MLVELATMASFLFNPARLEHPYGVGLFDDLHNYVPELLYDSNMFDTPLVPFIQRRVEDLFGAEFSRNRTQYRLFQQARRRTDSGIVMPVSTLYTLPARAVTPPLRRPTVLEPMNRASVTARTHTAILDPNNLDDGIATLLRAALQMEEPVVGGAAATTAAASINPISAILLSALGTNAFLNPVVVAPSQGDIQRATVLTSIEPAADLVCPICQDHVNEENTTREWRYIRHCNHGFHRSCIDHWFQEHVQCPVCRFDIREAPIATVP